MVIHKGNYKNFSLGAKAKNLFVLSEHGFPVPEFFCISNTAGKEETEKFLSEHFSAVDSFAVRSAARLEDGANHSFAGQFSTFLFVPPTECFEKACQISRDTKRASVYAGCGGKGPRVLEGEKPCFFRTWM